MKSSWYAQKLAKVKKYDSAMRTESAHIHAVADGILGTRPELVNKAISENRDAHNAYIDTIMGNLVSLMDRFKAGDYSVLPEINRLNAIL